MYVFSILKTWFCPLLTVSPVEAGLLNIPISQIYYTAWRAIHPPSGVSKGLPPGATIPRTPGQKEWPYVQFFLVGACQYYKR